MALFLESHEGVRLSSRKPYRGDGDRKQPRNNHKNPKNTSAIKKKNNQVMKFSPLAKILSLHQTDLKFSSSLKPVHT
jgi:hypothetical protein